MALFNKKRTNILSDLPKPSFDIPRFSDANKKESFPEYKPIIPDFSSIKSEISKPQQQFNEIEEEQSMEAPSIEQPLMKAADSDLFVKVNKYEQAMKALDELKDSFNRTEGILKNLQVVKQQEDREIANWTSQIQKLKNKVISIDSTLFESKK